MHSIPTPKLVFDFPRLMKMAETETERKIISKEGARKFSFFTTFSEYLFAIFFPLRMGNSIYLLINFFGAFLSIDCRDRKIVGLYFSIYFTPVVMVFVKKKFIQQAGSSKRGRAPCVYDDDVNKGKTARNR